MHTPGSSTLASALSRIEQAERETPFCDCGAPTVPVARGGRVWLSCGAHDRQRQPGRRVRRWLTLDFGHTARPILDLAEIELEFKSKSEQAA